MANAYTTSTPVAYADETVRANFLVKVYQHLALAVVAFIGLESVLFVTGIAERMYTFLRGSQVGWLMILGGFMVANMIASRSATKLGDIKAQYVGLFAAAAAQAFIFAPFLYMVFNTDGQGSGTVASAAIVTLVGFAALSLVAFVTKKDLSFLRPIIMWGGIAALGLIVCAVIFSFPLGLLFSVAMVALAGASILYQTQKIIRVYPEWAYVGAAVALFGSLMTLFWYVLRIFSRR